MSSETTPNQEQNPGNIQPMDGAHQPINQNYSVEPQHFPPDQFGPPMMMGPGGPQHPGMMTDVYEDVIGAIKVTDGIFIGDRYAAKDRHFMVQNKVTRIINCAGLQVRNHFEDLKEEPLHKNGLEVKYLTFLWIDTDSQALFEENDSLKIFNFINEAVQNGESSLVHCDRGQS